MTDAYERHILREAENPPEMVECPECHGLDALRIGVCPVCNGEGEITSERAAEDAAEAHGDQQMELARDRATGFEE